MEIYHTACISPAPAALNLHDRKILTAGVDLQARADPGDVDA
jgi:hypothetical protein